MTCVLLADIDKILENFYKPKLRLREGNDPPEEPMTVCEFQWKVYREQKKNQQKTFSCKRLWD